jgi:hypothetical protein
MKRKYAHDATKLAALQWALQQRMGWRSPLTVLCYDHSESDRERLEQFDVFLREIEQQGETDDHQPVLPIYVPTCSTGVENLPPSIQAEHKSTDEHTPTIRPRELSDLAFWEAGT